jgi:hypothetical protein
MVDRHKHGMARNSRTDTNIAVTKAIGSSAMKFSRSCCLGQTIGPMRVLGPGKCRPVIDAGDLWRATHFVVQTKSTTSAATALGHVGGKV